MFWVKEEFPDFYHELERQYRIKLTAIPSDVNETLVCEFYANACILPEGFTHVVVRGVAVSIEPEEFNSL